MIITDIVIEGLNKLTAKELRDIKALCVLELAVCSEDKAMTIALIDHILVTKE
jgi:hypothetical protein